MRWYICINSLLIGFTGGAEQNGWFQVSLGPIGGNVTYLAGAYETTPGQSIEAGAVPEPANNRPSGRPGSIGRRDFHARSQQKGWFCRAKRLEPVWLKKDVVATAGADAPALPQ